MLSHSYFKKMPSMVKQQTKGFKTLQTHFYTGGHFGNSSGIKVCIFGGNSATGIHLASEFLSVGTPINMVHRNPWDIEVPITQPKLLRASNPYKGSTNYAANSDFNNDTLKYIRVWGEIGLKMFTHCPDLTNEWDIENCIKGCDVIINTVGAHQVIRYDEDYEEANIVIPRTIAKVCAKLRNDPVKRFIHFSANGANPDSFSRNLRTKWIGEQEVRDYFPEATILRPTEILTNKLAHSFIG